MSRHRVPPNDIRAEEASLGAMLLSQNAITNCVKIVKAQDYYKPSHRMIYDAIVRLWEVGDPVDAVTVAGLLAEEGTLDNVGGPATLVSLMSNCPTTSGAPKYARMVVRAASYRRLIGLCAEVEQLAYDTDDSPEELADLIGSRLGEISVAEVGKLPMNLTTIDEFLDRPLEDRPPWVIPGLIRVGWRVMVVAAEGVGKALALNTPLPSPDGWTTMGEVEVGDRLFAADGSICEVTFATPIQNGRTCYEVEFSDGSVVVADADHLWVTQTCNEREKHVLGRERTTAQIASTLRVRKGEVANHSIQTCGPLDYEWTELPLDPYLLGVWLGDGSSRRAMVSTADPEIVSAFTNAGFTLTHLGGYDYSIAGERRWDRGLSFASALRRLDLIENKHIPSLYAMASVKQRVALLQGLMDSDGSISANGRCEFGVTSERLAHDVMELVVGLGHKATIRESAATLDGREVSRRWRITFMPNVDAFRLPRKLARQVVASKRASTRYIVDVRPTPSVPVKCVQVSSADSTYLCGSSCIPTHNTVLFRQMGMAIAQGIHPLHFGHCEPQRVLIVDLENPDDSIIDVCEPIRVQALKRTKDDYDPDRAWLWHQPGGIDLRTRRDRSDLEAVIAHVRPTLVCLGPIYKAYNVTAKESDELAASEVMAVFDDLRTRYKFALLLEHHAPKGIGKARELMPYGSSLWLRWPEIGLKLQSTTPDNAVMEVGRWRGDRLENSWPIEIERSQGWPWRGVWPSGTFTNGTVPTTARRDPIAPQPRDSNEALSRLPDEEPIAEDALNFDPETGEVLDPRPMSLFEPEEIPF